MLNAVKKTLVRKVNYRAKKIKHELKGIDTRLSVKKYFFKKLSNNKNYRIYTIIFKKNAFSGYKLPTPLEKSQIYNYLSRIILEQIKFPKLTTIRLIVDRSKQGNDILEFNNYLQIHLKSLLPVDSKLIIDHQMSQNNKGLQAVDLFAWGIFRKYETNDTTWYENFREKVIFEKLLIRYKKDGT